MASINKCILIGNVTAAPSIRYMPNGDAVANFSIATSENWKDKSGVKQEKTEFHNITAYRKLAEIIGSYVKKGKSVYIEGKLQTRKWEKDGITRYSTEIIANEMQMLGSRSDNNDATYTSTSTEEDNAPDSAGKRQDMQSSNPNDFDNLKDDIPF